MCEISIIVPIYNVEKYIRKCLDNILAQTFKDFEVLCVNDCGSDRSMDIVLTYCQKDKRFKIINMSKNSGVSAARNAALDLAKGKYIVFVDPDDWIDKTALSKIYSAFEKHNPDAVWFNSYHYDNKTKKTTLVYDGNRSAISGEMLRVSPKTIDKLTGCIWDKAFKLENIRKMNLRFPEGLIVEDDEFSFKYFVKYDMVYRINTPLYYYRQNRLGSFVDSSKSIILKDAITICSNLFEWTLEEGVFQDYKEPLLTLLAKRIDELHKFKGEHLLSSALLLQEKMINQNSFKFTV